jgi:PAS domain S-box-containing protein
VTEKDCILVVDDDEGTRKSLALLLKRKGFETEQAETGKEALATAEGRAINLTLLDIKLPDIEGIQLLEPLKKTNPDMAIIMITGFASVESAVKALEAGASGYITKPINLEELFLKVKSTLDHQHLVTDIRRAEEEKDRASREIFDLYNNAPCGYHSLDKDGNFVNINDTELLWLGYSREEIIGRKKFSEFITEKSRDNFNRNFPLFIEQGFMHDLEFDIIQKDGTILTVLASTIAIKNPDGSIFMSRSTLHNITERKAAEEALRESEEKFRGIFNNVNDAIHLHEIDKDGNLGKFIDVNDVACQMLQYTRDEMLHHTPLDFTGDYHSRSIDKIQEELVTRGNAVFETEHIRKDGSVVPVEINAHVITLMGKKVVLSVVRDITGRKKTDEQIRNSLIQIENDLVQMALFNDQIRNPLAVIIGLLDSEQESKTNTKICEQVYKIDALITTLDRQYMNSEKVREFLRKHYDFIQRSGL